MRIATLAHANAWQFQIEREFIERGSSEFVFFMVLLVWFGGFVVLPAAPRGDGAEWEESGGGFPPPFGCLEDDSLCRAGGAASERHRDNCGCPQVALSDSGFAVNLVDCTSVK